MSGSDVGGRGYGPTMRAIIGTIAVAVAMLLGAAPAHADPMADRICGLLASGSTPDQISRSVTVQREWSGGPLTRGEAMVLIRSAVMSKCPQFAWRL